MENKKRSKEELEKILIKSANTAAEKLSVEALKVSIDLKRIPCEVKNIDEYDPFAEVVVFESKVSHGSDEIDLEFRVGVPLKEKDEESWVKSIGFSFLSAVVGKFIEVGVAKDYVQKIHIKMLRSLYK